MSAALCVARAALRARNVGSYASACAPAAVRWMATAEEGSGKGFTRTEAALTDLYMRAVEPKPVPV